MKITLKELPQFRKGSDAPVSLLVDLICLFVFVHGSTIEKLKDLKAVI